MAKPISIPNTFAGSTSAIPLVYLDQDFSTLSNATNDLATYSNYVADTGVANAYIANYPTSIITSSLTAGLRLQFKATNANSGASTLNVQVNSVSIGSGSLKLGDGSALPANTIVANAIVDVQYDGTNFQIMNDPSGGAETITNLTLTGNLTVAGNTTLNTSLSGMAKLTSGVVSTGTAGTDYVAPNVATTFTAQQTLTGSTSVISSKFVNALEGVTVSATASTGTINYDVTTQSVLYYTTNATGNFTVNFRASSGTSLNTAMATGEAITVVFLSTQGATAYYNSAVQVDGSSVTPKYQGGTAWTAGNASGIDAYSYTIIKTGSATFTVLTSQTQFK